MSDSDRSNLNADAVIRFTGAPKGLIDGAWQLLPLDLGTGILFYLGVRRVWCTRAHLAALFWPESEASESYRRLRQHLQRLKSLAWSHDLQVENDRVRWAPPSDLTAFDRAFQANEMARALAHRHGRLLEGLQLDRSEEFSEWLRAERWALHDRWRQAAFHVVDRNLGLEIARSDVDLMKAIRRDDPFDEAALRRQIKSLRALGELDAAHRTYVRYRSWLENETGDPPEGETVECARSILDGMETMRGADPAGPRLRSSVPPAYDAPLVGREALLDEAMSLLQDTHAERLVTLWGPGGVGKTHLAVHLKQRWDADTDRPSLFVLLEDASRPQDVFRRIAEALQQSDDSSEAIGRALDHRVGLLILDNLEQISGVAGLLTQLLQFAPGLRIVATSRRAIGEAVGANMGVPPLDHRGPAPAAAENGAPSEADAQSTAAEQLFLLRARRRFSGIDRALSEDMEGSSALPRIARLTGGLPLAILLAAGWAGTLTLPEIADQLERGSGLLRSDADDLPERHRSIDGVFEHSWRLLTAEDREGLAELAVFRGGFERSAAEVVAGISAGRLRTWLDHAWLERRGARYFLHPLARRFLQDRLDDRRKERAERRHAQHYAALLEAYGALLVGPRAVWAMARLAPERGNVRAFWLRAVRYGWGGDIARAAHGLYEFLDIARAHPERHELLEEAVAGLEEGAQHDATVRLARRRCRIMLLTSSDACDRLLEEIEGSDDDDDDLDRALALSRASRLDPDLANARRRWQEAAGIYRRRSLPGMEGTAALRFGERLEEAQRIPEMVAVLEHAEALFDLAGSRDHAAAARVRRARGLGALGDEPGMRAELAACRHEIRAAHPAVCRYLRAEWLGSHLLLALHQRRAPRARRVLHRYQAALEAIGAGTAEGHVARAWIAEIEQDWNQALVWWRTALSEPTLDRITCLLGLARVRLALGHTEAAAVALRDVRSVDMEHPWALLELARWLSARGDPDTATAVLCAVRAHAEHLGISRLMLRADELRHGLARASMKLPMKGSEDLELPSAAEDGWRRFAELSER